MLRIFRLFSGIGLAALLVGLAIGVYAYTANNTVPATNSGDGSANISGYTISTVNYILGSNPANIASVNFTTSTALTAGETIEVSVNGGTTFIKCSGGAAAGTSQSCSPSTGDFGPISGATNLNVIISQ